MLGVNVLSSYPALARFYATRIELGKLSYSTVIKKCPQLKEDIDNYLIEDGYIELIED